MEAPTGKGAFPQALTHVTHQDALAQVTHQEALTEVVDQVVPLRYRGPCHVDRQRRSAEDGVQADDADGEQDGMDDRRLLVSRVDDHGPRQQAGEEGEQNREAVPEETGEDAEVDVVVVVLAEEPADPAQLTDVDCISCALLAWCLPVFEERPHVLGFPPARLGREEREWR